MNDSNADEIIARMMRKRIRALITRYVSIVCIILTILGVLTFTNGFLTAWGKASWITPKTKLPLGYPGSIAVDSNNNIYVTADFYYRIQKFSPDGVFIRGWQTHDNNPRIRINEFDQLELANDNAAFSKNDPDTLTTYDLNGKMISEKVVDPCHETFGEACERSCQDRQGNVYTIHHKTWWPYITKTDASGLETKVVKTPWYLWLIQGPLPSGLFLMIGAIGVGVANRWAPD